jgi:hypothetical protein
MTVPLLSGRPFDGCPWLKLIRKAERSARAQLADPAPIAAEFGCGNRKRARHRPRPGTPDLRRP